MAKRYTIASNELHVVYYLGEMQQTSDAVLLNNMENDVDVVKNKTVRLCVTFKRWDEKHQKPGREHDMFEDVIRDNNEELQ